jgi:hypothetical protein
MCIAVLLLGLIVVQPVDAGDLWPQEPAKGPLESPWQVSLGVGMRLDAGQGEEHQPNLSVQLLRFFTDHFALRFDLGYTPESRFYSDSRAETVTTAFGIRWQEEQKTFAPFLELDLGIWYFSGEAEGAQFSTRRGTIGGGLGVSIKSGEHSRFELGFRQHINDITISSYQAGSPGLPPEPPEGRYPPLSFGPGDPYSISPLANLSQFFVRYRFGL